MDLPFELDRIIMIEAPPEVVFSFFTDNARWASWWGAGSTIEPRVGGRVYICHPGNVHVSGEVLELRAPQHLLFTYGYDSGQPFPAGGSRVRISLDTVETGTRLHLHHEFPEGFSRDHHVQGWRFQLSLFSNAVLNVLHEGVEPRVDQWFSLWAEADPARRDAGLRAIASPTVSFRDRYSLLDGIDDVSAHIQAALQFMPGMKLERRGSVRHCQGTVLADWTAVGPDGAARGQGSNVFSLGADGKIKSVTGFWG
ncbi:MAG TPA: SRPBCC domain-containing protein [Vicinamibacterales bacterium]|nr:SRPBCC domain-containing protein [Vicinamibacterales bacterium]